MSLACFTACDTHLVFVTPPALPHSPWKSEPGVWHRRAGGDDCLGEGEGRGRGRGVRGGGVRGGVRGGGGEGRGRGRGVRGGEGGEGRGEGRGVWSCFVAGKWLWL